MQKYVRSVFAGLTFLISASFCATFHLCAQGPPTATAWSTMSSSLPAVSISYGKSKTLTMQPISLPDHVDFEPVGVYRNQELQINLRFPSSLAGQTIFVGALDDGVITTSTNSGAVTIGSDGVVSIGYRASQNAGRYHVAIQFGSQTSLLPFLVLSSPESGKALRCPRAD